MQVEEDIWFVEFQYERSLSRSLGSVFIDPHSVVSIDAHNEEYSTLTLTNTSVYTVVGTPKEVRAKLGAAKQAQLMLG